MDQIEGRKFVNVGNSSFVSDQSDFMAGGFSTDIVNMSEWNRMTYILQKGSGAVGTGTVTIEASDDASGSNTTAVTFQYRTNKTGLTDTWTAWATTASLSITAGADEMYEISVQARVLPLRAATGVIDKYVKLVLAEVDSTAVNGAVIGFVSEPRSAEDIAATVLT